MNLVNWNIEWEDAVKRLLKQVLNTKNNDEWCLHYEEQSRVDLDEFLTALFDDYYFEKFINEYKKLFLVKRDVAENLEEIQCLLHEVGKEVNVSLELLSNKKWLKIQEKVSLFLNA